MYNLPIWVGLGPGVTSLQAHEMGPAGQCTTPEQRRVRVNYPEVQGPLRMQPAGLQVGCNKGAMGPTGTLCRGGDRKVPGA